MRGWFPEQFHDPRVSEAGLDGGHTRPPKSRRLLRKTNAHLFVVCNVFFTYKVIFETVLFKRIY